MFGIFKKKPIDKSKLPLSVFYRARYCTKCKWYQLPEALSGVKDDTRAVIPCPKCGNHHVLYMIGQFQYWRHRNWYGKKFFDLFDFVPKESKRNKKKVKNSNVH